MSDSVLVAELATTVILLLHIQRITTKAGCSLAVFKWQIHSQQWAKEFSLNLSISDQIFILTAKQHKSQWRWHYGATCICICVRVYIAAWETDMFVCLAKPFPECTASRVSEWVCVSVKQMELDSHHWEISIQQCTGSGAKWGGGISSSNEEPITACTLGKKVFSLFLSPPDLSISMNWVCLWVNILLYA